MNACRNESYRRPCKILVFDFFFGGGGGVGSVVGPSFSELTVGIIQFDSIQIVQLFSYITYYVHSVDLLEVFKFGSVFNGDKC